METKIIRHIHKCAKAMYVMVSIPEANTENIFKPPIVLGVFKSKEDARTAWKARTSEYKSVKAKTVHIYYFDFQTDVPEIPKRCISAVCTELPNTQKNCIFPLYLKMAMLI